MAAVSGFIKYSMFTFNLIFWVCGCIILGVSIYEHVSKHGQDITYEDASGLTIFAAINLLKAVGTIIIVLGFLRCYGAMKETHRMLFLFFIALLLFYLFYFLWRQLGLSDLPRITQLVSVMCLRPDLNSGPPDSKAGALSTAPLLALIAIIQIVADVLGIVYKSKIEESFKKNFQEQVKTLTQDGTEHETFKNNLDKFQKKFKCCGLIDRVAD